MLCLENGRRGWGSSASCSGIADGLQKMFSVSMEGLRIYYYSTVCPMVSLLIRIMIYIKNHKGSIQVHGHTGHVLVLWPLKSFVRYYFVQSSSQCISTWSYTHTAQSMWCYLVGDVHIGSMLDQLHSPYSPS